MLAQIILLLLAGTVAGFSEEKSPEILEAGGSPPPAPEGYRWETNGEFTDEFDGNELDITKWRTGMHSGWKGREPSAFAPENVSVAGGYLVLRGTSMVEKIESVANPKKDVWIKAACVSSQRRSAYHGYYEVRMKASRLPLSSSFWLQGKRTEIDVVEQVGDSALQPECNRKMQMNTHYFPVSVQNTQATPQKWDMPSGSADEFHTYGVWWKDEQTVSFYYNGQKVAEMTPAGSFNEPMFVYFDKECFEWDGLPTVEALNDPDKNQMLVDWVRAWKLVKIEGT